MCLGGNLNVIAKRSQSPTQRGATRKWQEVLKLTFPCKYQFPFSRKKRDEPAARLGQRKGGTPQVGMKGIDVVALVCCIAQVGDSLDERDGDSVERADESHGGSLHLFQSSAVAFYHLFLLLCHIKRRACRDLGGLDAKR